MLKKIFLILTIFIFFLFLVTMLKINKNDKETKNIFENLPFSNISNLNITNASKKETKKEIVGRLIIKKLNIDNNLYQIGSKENNVDKNITILENSTSPEQEDSLLFIAAHSGTGNKAYFKNLDKLELGDEIILIYNNKTYTYEVKNYWEEKKDGDINFFKEDKRQLILTTCSPTKDDMQLVINCVEKD